MSDETVSFNPHPDDYDGQPKPRKAERAGKPRAAQFDSLDARLDQIKRDAAARWQETRAA